MGATLASLTEGIVAVTALRCAVELSEFGLLWPIGFFTTFLACFLGTFRYADPPFFVSLYTVVSTVTYSVGLCAFFFGTLEILYNIEFSGFFVSCVLVVSGALAIHTMRTKSQYVLFPLQVFGMVIVGGCAFHTLDMISLGSHTTKRFGITKHNAFSAAYILTGEVIVLSSDWVRSILQTALSLVIPVVTPQAINSIMQPARRILLAFSFLVFLRAKQIQSSAASSSGDVGH